MSNESLQKLIKNVNFDYASKFDKKTMATLSFLPVKLKGETFYFAISENSNKKEITEYAAPIINKKIGFVVLPDFDEFFEMYSKVLNEKYLKEQQKIAQAPSTPAAEQAEISLEADEAPINLDEDNSVNLDEGESFEIIDEGSEQQETGDEPQTVANTEQVAQPQQAQNNSNDPHHHVNKVAASVKNAGGKKLGEILIETGLITENQLSMALVEAKALDVPLGSALVKLGYVSIEDLKDALSIQQGVQMASEEQIKEGGNDSSSILPEAFIKTNKVIPISTKNNKLVIGMVNPGDTATINEVVYLTGMAPTVMMITHFEFEKYIDQFYGSSTKNVASEILAQINTAEEDIEPEDNLFDQVSKDIEDATGVVPKIVNKIVTMGIDQKASDIHIEPRFDGYVVRFRCDGILKEVMRIPEQIRKSLVSRFKVMSRMNIAEHRRPQDGNFGIKYNNKKYDFRINTLPVDGKEKVVIRILAPAASLSATKTEINIPGMLPEQLQLVKDMVTAPNGIILTSGPTGSGKTTTLYSLIKSLNDVTVNITTIEDPVEIRLEGINQSATNAKAGITFAACMRAILRQDPDIILVGEIRDYETLETAISAALTGHLVLSTVHTNSAAATVTRLIEMGAKDYLVSSTLTGVLAQRLVRRLCPHCKVAYKPTLEEAKKILRDPVKAEEFTHNTIYGPGGCEKCQNSGYAGRLGLYEVMTINKQIRKLIAQKAHDIEIEEYAVNNNGMLTLQDSCISHIKNGLTTIDEFVRVLGLATD